MDWLLKYGGRRNFEVIWEPLLRGKFGERAEDIGMVWLWCKMRLRFGSRGIRGERLGYLQGSFGQICDALAETVKDMGGEIHLLSPVKRIKVRDEKVEGVEVEGKGFVPVDCLISTTPSYTFHKLLPELPDGYASTLQSISYLAAMCLVLLLQNPLSHIYWLNIGDPSFPFVAAIEHTNFLPPSHYGGYHILYLSHYLPRDSSLFHLKGEELLNLYTPYLQRINPQFDKRWVEEYYLFKEEAAQPIITINYSQRMPTFITPIKGVYLANTSQIYPQDRGMNYSISLGLKVSQLIHDQH
jgi:protoporphyrinogen oxidase